MTFKFFNKPFIIISGLFVLVAIASPLTASASQSPVGFSKGDYVGDFVKEKESGKIWYIDTVTSRRYQISENDVNLFERLKALAAQQSWPRIVSVPESASKVVVPASIRIGLLGIVYDENASDILWHIQKKAYRRQALTSREDILAYAKNAIEISDVKKLAEYPIAYADSDISLVDPIKGTEFPADQFASSTSNKQIVINLKQQRLRAYEDGKLVNTFLISSGRGKYATRKGMFSVMAKVPVVNYVWSYGKDNPDNYDLGNVPYNLRIYPHTYIHYAYWHNNFGHPMSHGCVNVNLANIKWIFRWADEGIPVLVM